MSHSAQAAHRRIADRRFVRFAVHVTVPNLEPQRGVALNLSATGLLAALPRPVPLALAVRMRLDLPDGLPPADVEAIAVREERSGSAGSARVGFHFVLLPPQVEQRIRQLMFS